MRRARILLSVAATGAVLAASAIAQPAFADLPDPVCIAREESCFSTISDAVAAASPGDTITVPAGVYPESVVIDKSITLLGPNADMSANGASPLAVNPARKPEAIVQPPAGVDADGFVLGMDAHDVTVKGFTVELPQTVMDQRYFEAMGNTPRTLRFENNRWGGAYWANLGVFTVDGDLGADASLTFVGNRIENSLVSNGFWLNPSDTARAVELEVTDNVWLDNQGWAMNFGGAATLRGEISRNWIGNATPATSGSDQLETRQGGLILSGPLGAPDVADDLRVTHNTFVHLERASVRLSYNHRGSVSITDNRFEGYNNVAGNGAIWVQPQDTTRTEYVTIQHNAFVAPTAGSRAIQMDALPAAATGTAVLDARSNWWGQPTGPAIGQVSGVSVLTDPWCFSETCAPVTASVLLALTSTTLVAGSPVTATIAVEPSGAHGDVQLLENGVVVGTAAWAGSSLSFTRTPGAGTKTYTARFVPQDDRVSAGVSAAVTVTVASPPAAAPAPAPAADSAALDDILADAGVDVDETTRTDFVPAGGVDVDALDPNAPFSGTFAWPHVDHHVDVYAYSTPVFLGTFPVIDGRVVLDGVDLSALAPGQHRLVFVGQSSGEVSAMRVGVVGSSAGAPSGGGQASGGTGDELARTGADMQGAWQTAVLGALLLAGGAVMVLRRRLAACDGR